MVTKGLTSEGWVYWASMEVLNPAYAAIRSNLFKNKQELELNNHILIYITI